MSLRPIVRCLVVPVLGLSLSGLSRARCEKCRIGCAIDCECGCHEDRPAAKSCVGCTDPTAHGPLKVVNINSTSSETLMLLPGVGASLAWRIVNHRMSHGAFRRIEDLMQIKGIGEKFFCTLRPYVVVTGLTTLTEKIKVRA